MDQGIQSRNGNSEKILIVDDDRDTCKLLQLLFQKKGYHTMVANDGRQAIQQVQGEPPDLVVLDVLMPDMDGMETFRRVREISPAPVLFLSAVASGEYAAQALQLGAGDYLRKPYSSTELLVRVEAILGRANSANKPSNGRSKPLTEANQKQIIVLIPAYNEERFIGSVVLKASRFASKVIVIDDGSKDATAQLARDAGAVVISHPCNQGKGAALNTGFRLAQEHSPDVLVMLDGDGQHRPEELDMVIKPVLEGRADIVVGSRYIEHTCRVPRQRIWGHWAFNLLTRLTSGVRATDSQSGYRAFSPAAIEKIDFHSNGFSVESEMQFIAHDLGLRLLEVPITIRYQDPPKRPVLQHGLGVLNGILHLVGQYRPLLFIGLPGLLLLLAGLVIGVVVVERYEHFHVLAIGYAIICLLLSVSGLMMMTTGVTLHSIRGLLLELLGKRGNNGISH